MKRSNYCSFLLVSQLFFFHWKNATADIYVQEMMVFDSMPADFGTPIPYEGVEVSLKFLPENNETLFLCPDFQTDGYFQDFHQDKGIPDDQLLEDAEANQEMNSDDDSYSIQHMENKDDIASINRHHNNASEAAATKLSGGQLHAKSNTPLFPPTTSSKPIALLISRGQCSFEEKAKQAALNNISYLIVYDNVDQETLVEMQAFGDPSPIVNKRVGLVFVSQKTGLFLQNLIQQHEKEKLEDDDNNDVSDDDDFIVILNNQNAGEDSGWSMVIRIFFWMVCFHTMRDGVLRRRASASESLGVTTSTTLSEEQVSKLPTVQHDEQQHHQQCSICLEDFTAGETLLQLPCQHKFHTACIEPWLTTRHGSCPLCKRVVIIQEESTSSTTTNPLTASTAEHRHASFTSMWGRSGGRTLVATSEDDFEMTTVGTREEDSSLSTTSIIDLDASDNAIV